MTRATLWLLVVGYGTTAAFAFELAVHNSITRQALYEEGVVVGATTLKLSAHAIGVLDEQQEALDRGAPAPFWHFDDESFAAGNDHLIDLKNQIAARLTRANLSSLDVHAARRQVADALHQVQDFYAHSNWTSLAAGRAVSPDLGVRNFSHPLATAAEKTCDAGSRLSSVGLTKLTSGYFQPNSCEHPAGKCRHGGAGCEGISKDHARQPGFDQARYLAVSATKKYVQELLSRADMRRNPETLSRFLNDPRP